MQKKHIDWKDVASSYHEKSVTLAILILLFAFLVSPKIEVKSYHKEVKEIEAIDITPEVPDKIKPPDEMVKPQVEIVIEEDEFEGEDEEDIPIVETIEITKLDAYKEKEPPKLNLPSRFVKYEDPPAPIKQVPPEYSEFARKSGIEGQVWLDVVVLKDGSVGAVKVKKSLMPGKGGLDEAAVEAVKKWKFSPAKSGGKPVSVWVTFPVTFSLE
ncbi:MAG: hypothetical protein DRJ01_11610 [Bacteroidetes bacterium]|nr:MAG: hypothetical protein DRJ01_11610 [Bacteroidota bacterium]